MYCILLTNSSKKNGMILIIMGKTLPPLVYEVMWITCICHSSAKDCGNQSRSDIELLIVIQLFTVGVDR